MKNDLRDQVPERDYAVPALPTQNWAVKGDRRAAAIRERPHITAEIAAFYETDAQG